MARRGVLLVDDDPDILSMLGQLLAKRLPESAVRVASSSEKALRMLRDEAPAVIVADYRMPGMDGVEFLRHARTLAPQARFIMLTGAPDQFAAQSARAHSYTVLTKPIDPDLFVRLMQAKMGQTR